MHYRILIIGPSAKLDRTSVSKFVSESVDSIELQNPCLRGCLSQLVKCNLIITLKDWETDEIASGLAQIARIAQITIVHEINFDSYVQPKNN
jgi:hypothetical protein